jgi:rhodanese-related sulfurtransferase
MKGFLAKLSAVLFLASLTIAGCTGKKGGDKNMSDPPEAQTVNLAPMIGDETSLLLKELEEGGDYVNSLQYPSLIKASLVNEGLQGKNLIIDLRSAGQYAEGHIKGAVNKKFEDLLSYFETGIKPFEYEKIVLVCDDGQISGYTTSLLRLRGYGNVYSIRWGMSSWNKKYAEKGWLQGLSGKYEQALDTVTAPKPVAKEMPLLSTGFGTGKDVSDAMFKKLFAEGTSNVLITADEVFSNPANYFVINLERKDKYEDGHIPGAVRYKPDGTLGFTQEMATIPTDKTVVLYCGTGHNSAFATAYLRLFGYDARTLRYGNNSFMYDRMVKNQATLSWLPFTMADVNDYPVVK